MLERDALVGAHYRIVEKIGEGGMGSVWFATHERDGREVAIKVLHKILVGDTVAIARFQNEANAAGRLDHPNICRVIDVGEYDGAPYMVMDRLKGESLAERLARERTVPPVVAGEIALDVLSGLEAAHALGVLHRDLKPENIFLAREPTQIVPKILDFGVAKFVGDDAERVKMTRTGALVGTPAYMSPEQALGDEAIDLRSDLWAVGVLFYEMLVGKLPFEAPNYNAMLVKIATELPRPLRDVDPSLDPSLSDLVHRALARNREERFANAHEMAEAVRAWLAGTPLRLEPSRVAMPTPHTVTTPMSWAESSSPPGGTHVLTLHGGNATEPRRWLLWAVLCVVLGGAGFTIWRGSQRTSRNVPMRPALTAARGAALNNVGQNASCQLQILALPPDSRVSVNGTATQLPAHLRRGETARIDVLAPGYDPWTETVVPTGDVALAFEGRRTRVVATADAGTTDAADAGVRANVRTANGRSPSRRNGHGPLPRGVAARPDF